MRWLQVILSSLFLVAPLACVANAAPRTASPALIPAPATMTLRDGMLPLPDRASIFAEGEAALRVAGFLAPLLARDAGLTSTVVHARPAQITLSLDPQRPMAAEGYVLDVDRDGIRIVAHDEAGLFYGAVTLWQLLTPLDGATRQVPMLYIADAPRFRWRGLMLDSARHFQSVDEIKRLLDAMALHKLNTFHWHLTDDQGWRIEIRKYPKLATVGGCRIPAGDAGIDPASGAPKRYCGVYTQAQIRDVVRYAAERHIVIVPEIDVPGHAQAAVAAYPSLGSVDGPTRVSPDWGVHTYLFNAEPDTFRFLDDVLEEVVALFPGRYVHVGGDEAVKQQWERSPRVQARMRALGVRSEAGLQGYFVEHMQAFLHARGKRLIGWDEILESNPPADATVMSWRGIEGGVEAAGKGHDVVMSPTSALYLNYLQTGAAAEVPGPLTIIPLQKVYAFEPVPATLKPAERAHIIGLQANVWTEHLRTFARVEHAIFPRLAAVAETGWSPAARKDYADFLRRLPAQLQRYRMLGIDYARTPFAVDIDAQDAGQGTARLTLSTPSALGVIRYTTDGSTPVPTSPAYSAPLSLPMPVDMRATAFVDAAALTPATAKHVDAAGLLERDDEALATCSEGLMLRLEDDGPAAGPRAIYDVDIFHPCWLWRAAPLERIATVRVHAGRIPYNFQLWKDEANRKFLPARSAHGELDIHAGCDGALLASVALPASPGADGFVDLAAAVPSGTKTADLCFTFTGDTRPAMWVIDNVTLEPRR